MFQLSIKLELKVTMITLEIICQIDKIEMRFHVNILHQSIFAMVVFIQASLLCEQGCASSDCLPKIS